MKNKKCKGHIRPHQTRKDRSQIKIMLDEDKFLKRIAEKSANPIVLSPARSGHAESTVTEGRSEE